MKNITHLPTKATEKSDGGFTMIPNEMIQVLLTAELTFREFRIVFFLITKLQSWHIKERIIKTEEFLEGLSTIKQRFIYDMRSLIKKGVVQRQPVKERGCYIYRFNEAFFGKTHATKIVRLDKKILEMKKNEVTDSVTSKNDRGNNISYHQVTDSVTSLPRRMATMAAHHFPKDLKETYKSLKEEKNIRVFHSLRAGNGDRKGEWASPEVIQKCMLAFRRMPK